MGGFWRCGWYFSHYISFFSYFTATSYSDSLLYVHQCNLLDCVKEYWSQPARHIVRRYRQRHQQQQQQALSAVSYADGDGLALTRSFQLHECGYPDCGKQFRHKQHLLRHQTQKHGRTPTRILGMQMQRVWMKPDDMNSEQSFDSGQSFDIAGTVL